MAQAKTTLIKIIMGLLRPDAGEVLIDGDRPSEKTKAKVAYLPDKMTYPTYMTAGSLVRYIRISSMTSINSKLYLCSMISVSRKGLS